MDCRRQHQRSPGRHQQFRIRSRSKIHTFDEIKAEILTLKLTHAHLQSNICAMETPHNNTNITGVKVDSYDWESNSDSCTNSLEDSQRSNTFGENDVDLDGEGEGSVSSVDDSFCLLTDTEIVEMTFISEYEAGQFYNAYAKAIVWGFHNVGFTVKDMRNKLHSSRKEEIRNGDAEDALGYLFAQVNTDLLFFYKYTVDEDDRLETLFWTDGRSRMDYAAFGDVLVFNTTYRTNAYKKPFVILAGVRNKFMMTIFGCALLSKETKDTYNWVLSTFLEVMDGKQPISVVTDADFTTLIRMECGVEEFETIWADMVSHYGLETNAWVVEMYSDRKRWAEAYLLSHFFARMRSTLHCECMNCYLNLFLTVRLRLFEFVQQYHRGLARMRVVDAGAETATKHSTPDETQRASALIVARRVDEMERRLYFIEMYSNPESNWTVEYYPIDSRINCSCLMFESFGLPCCHMIVVMKYEHLSSIPPSLVMQRWTRYRILSSGYKLMSFYASHAHDSFKDARQVEHGMTSWMRKRWKIGKNKECNAEIGEPSDVKTLFGVGDPPVVKIKGNPGKNSTAQHSRNPRKCSHCKCRGPATIGKSEGQSKLHREINNLASLEGLRDMIVTVQENQISMWEKLKKVERVVCPHSDEDEDTLDDK
ncbi:hypothetical protein RHSIM_RhsimUnG0167300 [Rhododendron simsii]|uniref:SWIM-type domain-containing protein n=1 Tax=Rhododendron simsii TaxID=118357 RepID=A0A834FUQ6_RHOSS|nr:hypothetical protein RHSIM_RhsimUnG0167300 [Rhododendron simsii]